MCVLPVAGEDPDDKEGDEDDGDEVTHSEGGQVFANLNIIMMMVLVMVVIVIYSGQWIC